MCSAVSAAALLLFVLAGLSLVRVLSGTRSSPNADLLIDLLNSAETNPAPKDAPAGRA